MTGARIGTAFVPVTDLAATPGLDWATGNFTVRDPDGNLVLQAGQGYSAGRVLRSET
ncbi:MAG: hypothetical protein ACXV3C_03845 [Actinomycetes bacterium]